MKGTILNTGTVAGGALVGLAIGRLIPPTYEPVVMTGLGLVVLGVGVKMFLASRNVLVVAAAVALGGALGLALGIQSGIEAFASWAQASVGGTGRFAEAIITTSVLFCVGPMTLLGCIQDGLEGKSDLLALKSTLDGIGAIFFAAALGPGVLVTALVVLVFQGALTLLAKPLGPIAKDEDMLAEATAAGGVIMMAIGIGLAGIKAIPTAHYLPALFVAPILVLASRKVAAALKSG